MFSKSQLKEKAIHGTALVPIARHHLSYPSGDRNYFHLHWHDEFEFIVVLSGSLIYTIEDADYCISSGEGLFVNSNQLHMARSNDGEACEACVVVFHPQLFGNFKDSPTYSKFVLPILQGQLKLYPQFTPTIAWQATVLQELKIIDALEISELHPTLSEYELLLKSKLFAIWHHCYLHAQKASPIVHHDKDYKHERLKPVLEHIYQHYTEEISLATLANLIPMSEGQFCRTFKDVMNLTPIAYVLRYRILQSCLLLAETERKIADIAKTIGFNNISYFNREFLKAIGCSPKQYRHDAHHYHHTVFTKTPGLGGV